MEHAEEEGIIFNTLNNPIEILADGDDNVRAIRCIKMELGEPDASGRRRPVEVAGSEFDMGCRARFTQAGRAVWELRKTGQSE